MQWHNVQENMGYGGLDVRMQWLPLEMSFTSERQTCLTLFLSLFLFLPLFHTHTHIPQPNSQGHLIQSLSFQKEPSSTVSIQGKIQT